MPAFKFAPKTSFIGRNRVLAPDYDGQAVTPDDANDLPNGVGVGLYCTVGGTVAVNLHDNLAGAGSSVAALTLLAGTIYPIAISRIKATGTTATGIFALYAGAN